MKRQLLFLSLVTAALLAGCAKNEIDGPGDQAPRTHISAKAQGAGDIELDTKAPVTGTSLNGKTADVYTCSENLDNPADRTKMFSDAYARGTMTFDDNNYVVYNMADFGGLDGGKTVLPTDGTELYMYGFYPSGWARTAGATYESLTFTFDGSHDVMSTWLTTADDMQVKYNDPANVPDKADFVFKHLLTRYNILVKANDADAVTAWGRVKSIKIKQATVTNRVTFNKKDAATLGVGYDNDGTNTTPASFFKLTGTDLVKPTYSDDKFATADYTSAFALTTAYQNACYSMVAPVTVDATAAEELMLIVNTVLADGKEIAAEIPVMLDQTKFTAPYSTRGYSITLSLNFRVGVIEATATVEPWKDGGEQNEPVRPPAPLPAIGELKDGGIVYWVDAANKKNYKVFSLDQASLTKWSAQATYVLGAAGQSDADGKANVAAMKAYSAAHTGDSDNTTQTTGVFATDFPAAEFCDKKNTGGVTDWHLPAKDELKAFHNAYAANKAVIDAAITANSGTAIDGYYYWSSTEFSLRDSYAWLIDFDDHIITGEKSDLNFVRCIRAN